MKNYRCYFLAANGRFVAVETFPAKDDEEAILMARVLYAAQAQSGVTRHYGFELWQDTRRVYSEAKP